MLAPYTMALTLCFQAFWPASDRAAYEARYPFEEYGRGAWGDEAALEAFLVGCRHVGYVERGAPGPYRVAAPITGADGRGLAVLGLSRHVESGKAQTRGHRELVRELRNAARTIGGVT
jgi:DNA-binding IclR family transcriptional regulator